MPVKLINRVLVFTLTVVLILVCFAGVCATVPVKQKPAATPISHGDELLQNGAAALKSDRYEDAIRAAKHVLASSSKPQERVAAYRLLITATRATQSYDAAISLGERTYRDRKKIKSATLGELNGLSVIVGELKSKRASYLRSIDDERRIVKEQPKSQRASEAALKIAATLQVLGSRKEAVKAYETVTKDYPLTRPGWKAAQELAWLQHVASGGQRPDDGKTVKAASLEDARQALRESKYEDAERIARRLMPRVNDRDRAAAIDLLLQAISERLGPDKATTRAWQMACGTEEFTPTYSDVLRLEADVRDLAGKPTAKAKVAALDKPKQSSEQSVASEDHNSSPLLSAKAGQPTGTLDGPQSSSEIQNMPVSQPMGLGGVPLGSASSAKGTRSSATIPSSASPVGQAPTPPIAPAPVAPTPAGPPQASPAMTPVKPMPDHNKPKVPELDRWMSDTQLLDVKDDEQAVRSLMAKHLAEVANVVATSQDKKQIRRVLGVALTEADWASNRLGDQEWAKKICEQYLVPNINVGNVERWDYLSQETVTLASVSVYQKTGDWDRVIALYKALIDKDTHRNSADANRIRLAEVYAGQKRYQEAIDCLKQIDDSGDCAGMKAEIANLQQELQDQQSSGGSK